MMWVGRVGHVTCGWEGLVSCDVGGKGWCHVMWVGRVGVM